MFNYDATATYNGNEKLLVAPDDDPGTEEEYLESLKYRRSKYDITIELPAREELTNMRGPVYFDKYSCMKAKHQDNHFRFYRYEIN